MTGHSYLSSLPNTTGTYLLQRTAAPLVLQLIKKKVVIPRASVNAVGVTSPPAMPTCTIQSEIIVQITMHCTMRVTGNAIEVAPPVPEETDVEVGAGVAKSQVISDTRQVASPGIKRNKHETHIRTYCSAWIPSALVQCECLQPLPMLCEGPAMPWRVCQFNIINILI